MANEEHQTSVTDWFIAPDKSVSLHTTSGILLASRSHPFHKLIIAACRRDQLMKAIGYMRLDRNVSSWSRDSVRFADGVWYVNGKHIAATKGAVLNDIYAAGVEASVIASVLIKQQSLLDASGTGAVSQATMITDPLDSPDSCEISYYGWLEYLRRYGSECVDTHEDFDNKVFSVLSRSKKSGRVAFTATSSNSVLLALEVPHATLTCDEAIRWIEENVAQFSSVGVSEYLRRRTGNGNDVTKYYQRQIRRIRVN